MDTAVPAEVRRMKRRRRLAAGIGGGALLVLPLLLLFGLKPAAPSVDARVLWIDQVARGPMTRQVRGLGTLVPEEVRFIAAATEGRLERILVQPGGAVEADTVLMELSNDDLRAQAEEADLLVKAAEAQLIELRLRLKRAGLEQRASVGKVEADLSQAKLRAEADTQLYEKGLVPQLDHQLAQTSLDEQAKRTALERERLEVDQEWGVAQLAVQRTQLDQRRATARLKREQVERLQVRAGIAGVLQQISVQVGQRVVPATDLARVARPDRLKAVIRVAETMAKDLQVGQPAKIDTRNGVVKGHVARVDPAVQNGYVAVDLAIDEPLPKGARPDLSVEGNVELEHLPDVLHVSRPVQGQSESWITLFRLEPDGVHANRVKVRLGRGSVDAVEVLDGLQVGDKVILSDMSAWEATDRVQLE